MASSDIDFVIEFEGFNEGYSPLAHIDTSTFKGNKGQASEMKADIISVPGFLQQSPALANLTNGNESGVVSELIRAILDEPTATDTTYGIGTSKLFKISSTTVVSGGSPSWPQTITGMTSGESVTRMKNNLFAFYNKASGGDIAAMPLDGTDVIDPDWGSATDQALENALHPSASKEDILLFGNGRYVGAYTQGLNVLDVRKLDFGEGTEVADIVFAANNWWIAVNSGTGRRSRIYTYDPSAISNILSDEAGLGNQKIGFIYVLNGIVYVCYEDLSWNGNGYAIGWLSGRQIKPLRYFSGSLPDHRQKTLFKNTILFLANQSVFSCGASVEQLPIQISCLADAGYSTVGAIAAPFGTPMIASTDGDGHYRLAKFSGLSTDSSWKSVFVDVTNKRHLGKVHTIIISTKPLVGSARADITLEGNQGQVSTELTMTVSGANNTRHVIKTVDLEPVEDVRAIVNFANGDTTNPCPIRKITLLGNFVER